MAFALKACAHLGFQFTEFDGLERIEQAAKAGFQAAEWPGIFQLDRKAFMQAVGDNRLAWAQVTLPLGDPIKGEKGITALPGREIEFASDLDKAIDYALELNASFIHPMSGVNASLHLLDNRSTYIKNLQLTVHRAKAVGLDVLIEVISPESVPNYAMSDYCLARSIVEEVDGLHLLLDTYHASLLTSDVCKTITDWVAWGGRIGHVQVADTPGRHEPGTGSLDFDAIQAALVRAGYRGLLGCEYKPKEGTLAGLHHLRSKAWL